MSLDVASVADRVYGALREQILAGEMAAGERLHQEALSEQLGVSRTPLREALGRLAAEGLVELLPQRRARVAELRPEDVRAAYEARLVLEPGAAALAARRAADVEVLRDATARMRAAGEDVGEAFAANRDFHLAVVAAAENPYLLRFAETLWVRRVGLTIYSEQRQLSEFLAHDADAHDAIADAIGARDADAAEQLMRGHISYAMGLLLEHVDV
jgi:DNA-binding GntR family transcriptional regulator